MAGHETRGGEGEGGGVSGGGGGGGVKGVGEGGGEEGKGEGKEREGKGGEGGERGRRGRRERREEELEGWKGLRHTCCQLSSEVGGREEGKSRKESGGGRIIWSVPYIHAVSEGCG